MRVRTILIAGLAGAAAASLFDPVTGGTRRRRLRGRIAALARSQIRRRTDPDRMPPLPVNVAPARTGGRSDAPEERAPETDAPRERREDTVYMPQERLRGYLAETRDKRSMDDGAIVGRIRMKLLERPDLETRMLLVDVVKGVAYLRGELEDRRAIDEIVDLTRSVPGVRGVQNLVVIRLPESQTIPGSGAPFLGDAWAG